MSEKIILTLTLKEAAETLRILESLPENPLFARFVSEIKKQTEIIRAEREAQRQAAEIRQKYQQERKEAEEACGREGHPSLEPGGLVDTMTSPGKDVYVRGCTRCGESLVVLADGKLMEWIPWSDTMPLPPLAEEMFTDLPREKEGEFETPFTAPAGETAAAPTPAAPSTTDAPTNDPPLTSKQSAVVREEYVDPGLPVWLGGKWVQPRSVGQQSESMPPPPSVQTELAFSGSEGAPR